MPHVSPHVDPHRINHDMSVEDAAHELTYQWYDGDNSVDPPLEPLLDRMYVAGFFGLSPTQVPSYLLHATTEDPSSPPEALEFLTYLLERDTVALPDCGGWFDLRKGDLHGTPYLIGTGRFESSFPILIFRTNDQEAFNLEFTKWTLRRLAGGATVIFVDESSIQ